MGEVDPLWRWLNRTGAGVRGRLRPSSQLPKPDDRQRVEEQVELIEPAVNRNGVTRRARGCPFSGQLRAVARFLAFLRFPGGQLQAAEQRKSAPAGVPHATHSDEHVTRQTPRALTRLSGAAFGVSTTASSRGTYVSQWEVEGNGV
jgi:hypothetical protein